MMTPLQILTLPDLRLLSSAIRAGRLSPPFTPAGVTHACGTKDSPAVAQELQKLSDQGLSADHTALVLDLLADERENQVKIEDLIELVWTGPEVQGLPSRDTSVVVQELFARAQQSVLVAGYAVYQGKEVFQALASSMDQHEELKVKMFLDVQRPHGDTSLDQEILARFVTRFKTQEWPGKRLPEVYYDPRSLQTDPKHKTSLHAKCIVVDHHTSFVSSANFTEAAQVRNIEAGVLIRSPYFATRLATHFESLAATGDLKQVL